MQKLALVILDGFWINTNLPAENAISLAHTPTFDHLFSQLTTQLDASARAVGLPDGQMGNSEVGHMTIGTGRIVKQNLVEIEDLLDDGSFAKIPERQAAIDHCHQNSSHLHLLQLFWPGGVHAMDSHLSKILKLIPNDVPTFLHLFGDGRDLDPRSAYDLMLKFEEELLAYPHVKIASLAWRYYGMDRDNNRERIQKSYDEIMFGQLQTSDTPSQYIAKQYEQNIGDEFLLPVSFIGAEQIDDNDAVIHLNFRSDRARQMTQAIMVSANPALASQYAAWPKTAFPLKQLRNIYIATMTKYYPDYTGALLIKESDIHNTLGEVLAHHELRQLHIAETEKFAHVTKFFNGDKQIVYDGEKDILVPSHKVATYDLDPAMSATEITKEFLLHAGDFDFVVMNYANGDMVGHTGILDAAIHAIQTLDTCVADVINFCKENNYDMLMTADHGNCEEMGTPDKPKTAHTTNLVPFRYIKKGEVLATQPRGGLSDIAPTALSLMGIEIPGEMTGKVLV